MKLQQRLRLWKLAVQSFSDPYAAAKYLGIDLNTTSEKEIKKVYKQKSFKAHPDRNPEGVEEFKSIQNAYNTVMDFFAEPIWKMYGMTKKEWGEYEANEQAEQQAEQDIYEQEMVIFEKEIQPKLQGMSFPEIVRFYYTQPIGSNGPFYHAVFYGEYGIVSTPKDWVDVFLDVVSNPFGSQ
ncbi:MAG TPA: DnaJ domain-containing protein [Paenisporosarcina sp.]|nr:DnaJ domain-containing protein [Paenisporosarcina sp.]